MVDIDFNEKRSTFTKDIFENEKKVEYVKITIGLLVFITVFVIFIPHLLIKKQYYLILAAYFPNLDLLAAVLGYKGGPFNIWKYLYNPVTSTLTGLASTTLINLFALLGLTFVISYYTHKTKNIGDGWSRAFFMLPLTYLLPGNFLVYALNRFASYFQNINILHEVEYLLVTIFGLFLVIGLILIEAGLIEFVSPMLSKMIHKIGHLYNIQEFK